MRYGMVAILMAALFAPVFADDAQDQIDKLRREQKEVELELAKLRAKYETRILDIELRIRELELKQFAEGVREAIPRVGDDAQAQLERLQAAVTEYVQWAKEKFQEGVQKAVDDGEETPEEPGVFEPDRPKAEGVKAYREAEDLYEEEEFEKAAVRFHEAGEQEFQPANSFYNEACCLALAGHTDEALDALERATKAGYGDVEHLLADSDLESIREQKRFKALVKKLRK